MIALESWSYAQNTWQVFESNEKKLGGFGFFVSDVISKEGFWPFLLMFPGLGPNR